MSDQGPTILGGRYELHRRLARGGMADVFLARDQLLDRAVAVKVLFAEFAADPTFVERFRREAQAAANLSHPNIVGVYDWGREGSTYYIVMEYVEGRSLADVLRSEGRLHPDRAARITYEVAGALAFAHRNELVHRDIKPGNVLISPQNQVKVADFGIATAIAAGVNTDLTKAGTVMGTATYFSPEQAQGQRVDARSDLYSLGVVLYEMLTGEAPFTGDSPVAIAYKHVQEAPTPPSQSGATVPRPLEAITMRLLFKDPERRYPSADALRADLRRYRDGAAGPGRAAGAAGAAAAPGSTDPTTVSRPVSGSQPASGSQPTTALPANRGKRQAGRPSGQTPANYAPPAYPPGYDAATPVYPYGAYDRTGQTRRTGLFVLGVVLLILAIVIAAVILVQVLEDSSGNGNDDGDTVVDVGQIAVPSVIGLDQFEAIRELENAGFVVRPEQVENAEVPEGQVFAQNPQGGIRIDEGSVVTVTVSAGAEAVAIPNVVGQQATDAAQLLDSLGFTVVTEEIPDEDAEPGEVLAQSPAPGESGKEGDVITLTLSEGPEMRPVPNVGGNDPATAAAALTAAGFQILQERETSLEVPEGQVIRTEPAAGTELEKDAVVTMFISDGEPLATVPSVVGLDVSSAIAQISAAGLEVSQSEAVTTDAAEGTVIDQSPNAFAEVEPGSVVGIVVARAPDPTPTPTPSPSPTPTATPGA
ncbi:MAG: Stk1 family PASTA domain-containing Ser/Thr kinase [Acidimicrobiales bacterium]